LPWQLGGLFLGWFSPTQAGGIGAFGALVIGSSGRGSNLKITLEATRDGLRTALHGCSLSSWSHVVRSLHGHLQYPFQARDWVGGLPISHMAIMGIIIFIYFIGGFFMDSMALIVVTLPIFFPRCKEPRF